MKYFTLHRQANNTFLKLLTDQRDAIAAKSYSNSVDYGKLNPGMQSQLRYDLVFMRYSKINYEKLPQFILEYLRNSRSYRIQLAKIYRTGV